MKKNKGYRQLTSAIHFHTAMLDQTPIYAFQYEELIGRGTIDHITAETIIIQDEHFVRENCTFVYANQRSTTSFFID